MSLVSEIDYGTPASRSTEKVTLTIDGRQTRLNPEIATFKKTTNRMIDQLQEFASQVTRLAREVGTEGQLGGLVYFRGGEGKGFGEARLNGLQMHLHLRNDGVKTLARAA